MSIFGLWASSMVLFLYYTLHNPLPFCTLGSQVQASSGIVVNCYTVLSSKYDSVFGVPLDALAAVYFIINLFLVYLIAFGSDRIYRPSFKILFAWRFFGLALVPYLIYLEVFVLKAICIYCTMMHAAILIDFAIITYFIFYRKSIKTFVKGKD